ncbi:MAG TPA: sigma 54-interacting transcriptional regulator, partial [Spirochaetia bacterium]|nr:sigma 54-interacting transcriptional regulator [Spirochaetia bacterium]
MQPLAETLLDAPPESPAEVAFPPARPEAFHGLVGRSAAMRELGLLIERVAPAEATVLLSGESGTGKELAALAIHERSPRSGGPFVAVNCAA